LLAFSPSLTSVPLEIKLCINLRNSWFRVQTAFKQLPHSQEPPGVDWRTACTSAETYTILQETVRAMDKEEQPSQVSRTAVRAVQEQTATPRATANDRDQKQHVPQTLSFDGFLQGV